MDPKDASVSEEAAFLDRPFDAFEGLLGAARSLCIDNDDLYFSQTKNVDTSKPINPRNEAAALSLALRKIQSSGTFSNEYSRAVEAANGEFGRAASQRESRDVDPDLIELKRWVIERGTIVNADIGYFKSEFGSIRGLTADRNLEAGEVVVSVPESELINLDTVLKSDLGSALSSSGMTEDFLTVIWTMIDSRDPESEYSSFWKTLPRELCTGLGFGREEVESLKGTAACNEITSGQENLMMNYESIKPLLQALYVAYPDSVTPESISYRSYLWAVQLWYSYAIEVENKEGDVKSSLVPFACLINHSPWPHIIRYGRINPQTTCLEFKLFRGCKKDEELSISYGALPNQKLLTYYGFVVPRNPFDFLPFDIQLSGEVDKELIKAMDTNGIGLSHRLRKGPLSHELAVCCRALSASNSEGSYANRLSQYFKEARMDEASNQFLLSLVQTLKSALEAERSVIPSQNQDTQKTFVLEICAKYRQEQMEILEENERILKQYLSGGKD